MYDPVFNSLLEDVVTSEHFRRSTFFDEDSFFIKTPDNIARAREISNGRDLYDRSTVVTAPTLNSRIDSAKHGYEPSFIKARDAQDSEGSFCDVINLIPGNEYTVQVLVVNDSDFVEAATGRRIFVLATGTAVSLNIPDRVEHGKTEYMTAFVSSVNAVVPVVVADLSLQSQVDVELEYVSGSAHVTINDSLKVGVSEEFLRQGIKVYTGKNLGIQGGDRSVILEFRVKAKRTKANFSVNAQVRQWATDWNMLESYIDISEPFYVAGLYRNTGAIQQDSVVIKFALPKGAREVEGTTTLHNSKFPNGRIANSGICTRGLNVGSYAPNGNFACKVEVIVDDVDAFLEEEARVYVTVITADGNKQSSVLLIPFDDLYRDFFMHG